MTALGRIAPPDWDHVSKYPLAALGDAAPTQVPVQLSVNWYEAFDTPQQDGHVYRIGDGDLGRIRGGHCVCLEPAPDPTRKGQELDNPVWHGYYDQGHEGSCVGHGSSRVMSLLNRKRYDAVWLYEQAQQIDGFPLPHEGTTGRAALEVLRTQGGRVAHGHVSTDLHASDQPNQQEGIAAYRWATSAQEVHAALGLILDVDYVTILNSWGTQYPHRVVMPLATLDRLLREDGEAGIITDK